MSTVSRGRMEDLLPFLLMGKRGDLDDLLPLILMMSRQEGDSECSDVSSSHGSGGGVSSATLAEYMAGFVGDRVRITVNDPVFGGHELVGCLDEVGTDFLVLSRINVDGIAISVHRAAILLSNVVQFDRIRHEDILMEVLLAARG